MPKTTGSYSGNPSPPSTEEDRLSPLNISTVNQAADMMLDDLELSPLSKRTYRHGLNALVRYLHIEDADFDSAEALGPYLIARLNEEVLAGFNRWLREAYPDQSATHDSGALQATRTTRTYLVAARRLMDWLDIHDLLPSGVTYERMVRRIDQGRGQRRQGYKQRKVDPEVMRVLTHYMRTPLPPKPGARRLTILRNRALLALLYDTGMRISEALALTREDVLDGRARKIRLVRTKNGKPRTVFIADSTRQLIRDYVKERDDERYAPLFVSHGRGKGSAITPAHAWLLVKKAAEAEGLYENTSPHSLRHRRAQDLLDEGMPLEWVAALLGHEHPDTTRVVYAWETNEERLADMVSTYGIDPLQASQSGDENA
jgi:integrase